jgi:hypothetical protein
MEDHAAHLARYGERLLECFGDSGTRGADRTRVAPLYEADLDKRRRSIGLDAPRPDQRSPLGRLAPDDGGGVRRAGS